MTKEHPGFIKQGSFPVSTGYVSFQWPVGMTNEEADMTETLLGIYLRVLNRTTTEPRYRPRHRRVRRNVFAGFHRK